MPIELSTPMGMEVTLAQVAGPMEDGDSEVVAAAGHGDAAAIEQLMRRHGRRIFRLAHNITGNHEDAEEVVQDAFHIALLRLGTFRGDSRFSTWLTRIAINQALMVVRRHRPHLLPLDESEDTSEGWLPQEIADWGPNPEQRYAQRELQEILNRVAAELKADQRIVFQLRDLEQLSIEETARALGISTPAVKSRLLRARLALREKLNQYFGPVTAPVQPTLMNPVLRAAGAD